MPIKKTADKIRVLYVLADMQGCGWYRCMIPSFYLQMTGEFHAICAHELAMADLYNYDIVIFQRHFEDKVKPLWDAAKMNNSVIIYETDDDFFNIRPSNPANKFIHQKERYNVRDFLKKADAIIVSTPFLRSRVQQEIKRTDNIYVIPNMIEIDDKFLQNRKWEYDKGVRIFYSGGPSHIEDFYEMQPCFEKLKDKYGDKIQFYFMGWAPDQIKNKEKLINFIPWQTVQRGIQVMSSVQPHIGIVPLHENIFNRSKSNIKWLEYTISGAITVASKIIPYEECIEDGVDGILIPDNKPNSWVDSISKLMDNTDLIKPMWDKALNRLQDSQYNIRSSYQYTIIDVIKNIYDKEMAKRIKKAAKVF